MTRVKIYPAEGFGAHIRSVDELSTEVEAVRNIAETAAGGGVEEAPQDTTAYVRQDASWLSAEVPRKLLIARVATPPQIIPTHDGTDGTELTIKFGNTSTATVDLTEGIFTILETVTEVIAIQEIHINRTGGGPVSELAMWVESSADSGVTWDPQPDSLRQYLISNDGDGGVVTDFSIETPLAAGGKFRMRATNIGGGNLSIQAPTTLTIGAGSISGFAAKLTFLYST